MGQEVASEGWFGHRAIPQDFMGGIHMGNGEQGCHASRTLLGMSIGMGNRVRKPDCL